MACVPSVGQIFLYRVASRCVSIISTPRNQSRTGLVVAPVVWVPPWVPPLRHRGIPAGDRRKSRRAAAAAGAATSWSLQSSWALWEASRESSKPDCCGLAAKGDRDRDRRRCGRARRVGHWVPW